jgi:hypothetical protein
MKDEHSYAVEAYLTAHHLTWSELIKTDLTRQALLLEYRIDITCYLIDKKSDLMLKDLLTLTLEPFTLIVQHAQLYSFTAGGFSFTNKGFLPQRAEKQILLFKNLSRLKIIYEKSHDYHFNNASGIFSTQINEYAASYDDPDKRVDGLIALCNCFEKEDDPKKPKTNQLIANRKKKMIPLILSGKNVIILMILSPPRHLTAIKQLIGQKKRTYCIVP